MKRLFVLTIILIGAFGAWQQSSEIALPKSIQVLDLTIDSAGELWILSAASLLRFDAQSRNAVLAEEIPAGRLIASQDRLYIVDNLGRLMIHDPAGESSAEPVVLGLNQINQLTSVTTDDGDFLIVLEPNQVIFCSPTQIIGRILTKADRIATVPRTSYTSTQTPLFTLANNQIHAWTGGDVYHPDRYSNRLIYSSSQNIIDLSADAWGDLYILFSDSIVVLDPEGDYKAKVAIDNVPVGSRILNDPAHNTIILFNRIDKTFTILTSIELEEEGNVIVLHKNIPNPVDNYTQIEFSTNQPLHLAITVYNLIGEPIRVIAKGFYPKGTHRIIWDARDENGGLVPNGVYFYRFESEHGVAIRQLIVLR